MDVTEADAGKAVEDAEAVEAGEMVQAVLVAEAAASEEEATEVFLRADVNDERIMMFLLFIARWL